MKETKRLFGMRLKELRQSAGVSQDQLAESADISSKYLSRIEVGKQFPSIDKLVNLSKALNIELKDLFEFDHLKGGEKELKKSLTDLMEEAGEEKLRLIFKIGRAIVK
ncbi:MAG: helix-turn-helix domain-containing protein [Deltaproteobacteria bacterium]|nr:helix-turn-helix domain-containing protein [Deltaproteobacteria bacterium]